VTALGKVLIAGDAVRAMWKAVAGLLLRGRAFRQVAWVGLVFAFLMVEIRVLIYQIRILSVGAMSYSLSRH